MQDKLFGAVYPFGKIKSCFWSWAASGLFALILAGSEAHAGPGQILNLKKLIETDPAFLSAQPAALTQNDLSHGPGNGSVRSVAVRPFQLPRLGVEQGGFSAIAPQSDTAGKLRTTLVKPAALFGAVAYPAMATPLSTRWNRVLADYRPQDNSRKAARLSDVAYAGIYDQVKGDRRGIQIAKVNYMVNRLVAYREDKRLWGRKEYWASPAEVLKRRAGDCEDYAILKYALLRDLGVEDQDMRIVALKDTTARQHHAVLTVRHGSGWLVLDNRFSRVRLEQDLPSYQPLFSLNEAGAWAHPVATPAPVRLASRLRVQSH